MLPSTSSRHCMPGRQMAGVVTATRDHGSPVQDISPLGKRLAVAFPLLVLLGLRVLACVHLAVAQEGEFLTEEQAPAAVFPQADAFERKVVDATPQLRNGMRTCLGGVEPSMWEDRYVTFKALRASE